MWKLLAGGRGCLYRSRRLPTMTNGAWSRMVTKVGHLTWPDASSVVMPKSPFRVALSGIPQIHCMRWCECAQNPRLQMAAASRPFKIYLWIGECERYLIGSLEQTADYMVRCLIGVRQITCWHMGHMCDDSMISSCFEVWGLRRPPASSRRGTSVVAPAAERRPLLISDGTCVLILALGGRRCATVASRLANKFLKV